MPNKLPTYEQLRHYWLVSQGDTYLPAAMFLLECDAKNWIEQQESKEFYSVVRPLLYDKLSAEKLDIESVNGFK